MAYAAVTSLMRTIHQSMELTGCDLQPFYEKLESLRAILEKSFNIMGDHEGLIILEVEIVEVAYTTEYMGWNYLQSHEPTENRLVLKSLQCLNQLNPRYCTGFFFRLFPNLKKLQVFGVPEDFRNRQDLYDFRYLYQLEELEFQIYYSYAAFFLESTAPSGSTPQDPLRFHTGILHKETHFRATAPPTDVPTLLLPPPDAFPQNLKSLTFRGEFCLAWKDLSIVG